MDTILFYSFAVIVVLRLTSVWVSKKHEKALRANNAVEHGAKNTKALALIHTLFYFASFFEGYYSSVQLSSISLIGFGVYVFSMLMLVYVIYSLKSMWTVKLFISPKQMIVKNLVFKHIKHPNYFLNIIPELIGVALIFQSLYSFVIIFPIYVFSLGLRIKQENAIMKQTFSDY